MSGGINVWYTLIFTFIIGYVGFTLLDKLHIPAGALTGSLIFNSAFTVMGVPWAEYPSFLLIIIQAVIGCMVASCLSGERVKAIKNLIKPIVFLSAGMILNGLVTGYILVQWTNLDVGTAYISATPAGMSEMCALAMSYNYNVPVVALFHFLRIVIVYLTVPVLAKQYLKKAPPSVRELPTREAAPSNESPKKKEYPLAVTLAIGMAFGVIGWKTGIPNGAMLFPMIFVGAARIKNDRVKAIPKTYVSVAMVMLGASLGLRLTPEVALALLDLTGMAVFFSVLTFLNSYALGYLVHRFFKLDIITSILACASAGVTQMAAIAMDMDADVLSVSLLHSLRLIIVIVILPPFIIYMAG